jgi:hypothetical protein
VLAARSHSNPEISKMINIPMLCLPDDAAAVARLFSGLATLDD